MRSRPGGHAVKIADAVGELTQEWANASNDVGVSRLPRCVWPPQLHHARLVANLSRISRRPAAREVENKFSIGGPLRQYTPIRRERGLLQCVGG